MRFEIVPFFGVGPARLGMHRDEVRAAMNATPSTFLKTADSRWQTDAFFDSAFQVFHAGDEPRIEYLELSRRAGLEPFFEGVDIFATPAEELVARLDMRAPFDRSDPELGYSYVFPAWELALWRPTVPESADDEEGYFFSTVGVGTRGYFTGNAG